MIGKIADDAFRRPTTKSCKYLRSGGWIIVAKLPVAAITGAQGARRLWLDLNGEALPAIRDESRRRRASKAALRGPI
jgi:hypothetical protein